MFSGWDPKKGTALSANGLQARRFNADWQPTTFFRFKSRTIIIATSEHNKPTASPQGLGETER